MVFTEDVKDELRLRFRALAEYETMIEAHQEEIKESKKSMRETIKMLAKKLQCKQANVKKAFSDFKESIQNKEDFEEREEIFAILKEHNLMED